MPSKWELRANTVPLLSIYPSNEQMHAKAGPPSNTILWQRLYSVPLSPTWYRSLSWPLMVLAIGCHKAYLDLNIIQWYFTYPSLLEVIVHLFVSVVPSYIFLDCIKVYKVFLSISNSLQSSCSLHIVPSWWGSNLSH